MENPTLKQAIRREVIDASSEAAKYRFDEGSAVSIYKIGETVYLKKYSETALKNGHYAYTRRWWSVPVKIVNVLNDRISFISESGKISTRPVDHFCVTPTARSSEFVGHVASYIKVHFPFHVPTCEELRRHRINFNKRTGHKVATFSDDEMALAGIK